MARGPITRVGFNAGKKAGAKTWILGGRLHIGPLDRRSFAQDFLPCLSFRLDWKCPGISNHGSHSRHDPPDQRRFVMTVPVTRRQFLGTSAGSAVALASGPLLAHADDLPSRQVRVGIMGLNRGMQVAAALDNQPGVVIKYVCDVDSRLADKAKAQLERSGKQRPLAITDFRTILDDREVDALFCEAPNHWHGPATILATAAGKHVYVEKPCSHNPWEGEQMIAAARKHNRAVQMGVQRRSTPGEI